MFLLRSVISQSNRQALLLCAWSYFYITISWEMTRGNDYNGKHDGWECSGLNIVWILYYIRRNFLDWSNPGRTFLGGNFLGENCPGRSYPGWGFPGGNCLCRSYPGREFSWWEFSGWELSWVGIFRVGVILGGNFPGGNYLVGIIRVAVFLVPLRRCLSDLFRIIW